MLEEGAVMKTLIVSNFPDETTEEDVRNLFQEYQVQRVTLRPKKYAVVTFQNDWLRVKRGRW
jgi:hypothetical protein